MSAFISCHFFDDTAASVVPVIAAFDTKGCITPLYVRIESESLRIVSFFSSVRYTNTIEFRCRVLDNGLEKPLLLTYYAAENMWTIPRREET